MPNDADDEGPRNWTYLVEGAIARKIRQLRAERGLSQEKVAERMSSLGHPMRQTTIAKIEAGSRPIRVAEAVALAAIFDLPFEALWHMPVQPGEPTDVAGLRQRIEALDKNIEDLFETLRSHMRTIAEFQAQRTWLAQNAARGDQDDEAIF